MDRRFAYRIGHIFLVLVFLSIPLFGQTAGTSALIGVVTDPTSAVILDATVTATNTGTGQARTATTGSDGTYKIGLLPPGAYKIKFEAKGFRTTEFPSITLIVTEAAVLNPTLEVGSSSEEVKVEAEAQTVQTTSAALGTNIESKEMTDLPLASRNYTNLLSLSAGASAAITNAASVGKNSQDIAVNGSTINENNYQMDGASITVYGGDNRASEAVSFGVPNPDTIQEFKMQTSQYDAGFGRNAGANVNVVTKSGTNHFHGTVFEFLRNSVLNANDWFSNFTGSPRGALNQNQFGGTVGGPLKRDKIFFFASFQETAQKNGLSPYGQANFTMIPLPGGKRGTCPAGATTLMQCDSTAQSFVQALGTMYGGKTGAMGTVPIADDGSNINPVALQILQLKVANGGYYLPTADGSATAPGVSCNGTSCTSTVPAIYNEYQGMGNWDYVINSKHTFAGRYFVSANPLTSSVGTGNTSVPGSTTFDDVRTNEATLKETAILSNSMVNEARLSYQRNLENISAEIPYKATQVGMEPIDPVGFDLLPLIGVGNLSFGTPIFSVRYNVSNQFQLADQLSWTRGKHSIRTGVEIGDIQWHLNYKGLEDGDLIMPSAADLLLGTNAAGNGSIFSNILAEPTFATRDSASGASGQYYSEHSYSAFFQDDFKATPRLTLNLGLRWEFDGYPSEIYGENPNIDPSLTLNAAAPVVQTPCQPYPATCAATSLVGFSMPANYRGSALEKIYGDPQGITIRSVNGLANNAAPKDNFAPRLGFAWQPAASSKLAIRGGAGFFYDLSSGNNFARGTSQSFPYAETVGGGGPTIGSATLQQPYVSTPANWLYRWVTPDGQSSNIAQATVGPKLQTPVIYLWSLNTQYEFRPTWILELGYVGSRGVHQDAGSYPLNAARLVNDPVTGAAPSLANVYLRVPYLGFQPSLSANADKLDSKFNSLQATVRKQLSHGLQLQGAYTFSRAFLSSWIGNGSITSISETASPVVSAYGLSQYYRPHRFTLQYSYDLPTGNLHGFLGMVARGWRWSGETTIQDGDPLTIVDSSLGTIFGFGGGGGPGLSSNAEFCPGMSKANVYSSGSIQHQIIAGTAHLNAAAFGGATGYCSGAVPQIGGGTGFGNSGLGIALGPGQNNWDMSLGKTAKLGLLNENTAVEFRAEFFNAFNHPQFADPSTDVNSSTFGMITGSSVNPRLVQFALKFLF
jgi:hypothetical protein